MPERVEPGTQEEIVQSLQLLGVPRWLLARIFPDWLLRHACSPDCDCAEVIAAAKDVRPVAAPSPAAAAGLPTVPPSPR